MSKKFAFAVMRELPPLKVPQPDEIQGSYEDFLLQLVSGRITKLYLDAYSLIPCDYPLVSDGAGSHVAQMPEIPGVEVKLLATGEVIITVDEDKARAPYQVIGIELSATLNTTQSVSA